MAKDFKPFDVVVGDCGPEHFTIGIVLTGVIKLPLCDGQYTSNSHKTSEKNLPDFIDSWQHVACSAVYHIVYDLIEGSNKVMLADNLAKYDKLNCDWFVYDELDEKITRLRSVMKFINQKNEVVKKRK